MNGNRKTIPIHMWKFLKKKERIKFTTVMFVNLLGENQFARLFDYPEDIPTPRIGERIQFNSKYGKVIDVVHSTSGNISEIKIVVQLD